MAARVLSTEKRKQLYCCSPNMKTTKNIKRIVFNQASVNVYTDILKHEDEGVHGDHRDDLHRAPGQQNGGASCCS